MGYISHKLATRFPYNDVIMGAMASQITSLTTVYSTVYSGADQRKHQSSVSLAFVWGIHRWPVKSPHKLSVTRKRFTFDDVIILAYRGRGQNCSPFTNDIFKCIFLERKRMNFVKKFTEMCSNSQYSSIASDWDWPGDKPLSEPIMISLLTHVCVPRHQRLNSCIILCVVIITLKYTVISCYYIIIQCI